jgi:hypothetical protein
MAAREAILGTLVAAVICAPVGSRQNNQSANPRDHALATALGARDATQAVRLATEALSTPLSLPAGHPAVEVLGSSLRSKLPALLSNTPPGPISSAHLNNLGVALALRGWTDSAAVAFSGAMLVADPRTAGVRWGSALDPAGASRSTQNFQYSSSTPNPVVVNIENLSRLLKSGVGSIWRPRALRVLQRPAGERRETRHA